MPPNLGDRSFFLLIVGRLPSQITVSRYYISKISKISFLKDWAICQGIKPNTTLVHMYVKYMVRKKVYIYHISGLGQNRSSAKGRGNFIALFYTFLIAHQSTNKKDPPRGLHVRLLCFLNETLKPKAWSQLLHGIDIPTKRCTSIWFSRNAPYEPEKYIIWRVMPHDLVAPVVVWETPHDGGAFATASTACGLGRSSWWFAAITLMGNVVEKYSSERKLKRWRRNINQSWSSHVSCFYLGLNRDEERTNGWK